MRTKEELLEQGFVESLGLHENVKHFPIAELSGELFTEWRNAMSASGVRGIAHNNLSQEIYTLLQHAMKVGYDLGKEGIDLYEYRSVPINKQELVTMLEETNKGEKDNE